MSENDESLWIPWIPGKVLDLGDGIRVGLVDVTPEVAENWLTHNTRNRPIWDPTSDRYARDMINDRWPFTGDPVRFSDQDEMLDGQHRCKAVEDSGTKQQMLVVSGLPTSTQAHMDDGRKRNAGQTLGIDKTLNSSAVASVSRLALRWNPGGLWDSSRGTELFSDLQISTAELLAFPAEHPQVHEAARMGTAVGREVPGARPSVIGVAYLRAMTLEEGVFPAAEWFQRLETGAGLKLGDPVLALRNGMMRMHAEKMVISQAPQLWKVVRAWNASRGGEDMDRMVSPRVLSNGNFPDMR